MFCLQYLLFFVSFFNNHALIADMGKCDLTKGKQALEIRSSLCEKRALTDPIHSSGCSAESLARNLQWAKAHGKIVAQSCIGGGWAVESALAINCTSYCMLFQPCNKHEM